MPRWFPRAVALAALLLGGQAQAAGALALAPLQRALLAQCTDAGGPGTPCVDFTCCVSPYYCDGTQCCSYNGSACTKDGDCCQIYGPEACAKANGKSTCCATDGGGCFPGFANTCCPGFSCQPDPTSAFGASICRACGLPNQTACTQDQDCCSGSCKGTVKTCCEGLGQQCVDSLDCCGQTGGSGNPALSCSAPDGYSGRTCCNRIKGTPCSSKKECCSGKCIQNKCA